MWVVFICENFNNLICYLQILNKACSLRLRAWQLAGLSAGPYSAGRKELGVTELCVCKTFTLTNAGLACYDAGNR